MFGDFTDEGVIGENSTSKEHIDPNNGTLEHGIDQAWEKTKQMGSNVLDEITRFVGFGSIAFCVNRPDVKAIHHFNDVNTKIWSDSKASADATHAKDFPGVDLDAEKPAAAIDEFQDTNKANEIDERDYEPTEKEDKSNHKEDKSKIEKAIGSVKRRLSKTLEAVFSDDVSKKGKQAPPSNDDDVVSSEDDEKKFVMKGGLSNVRDLESANKHDDVDDNQDQSNHKEDKSMIEKAIGSLKRRISKTWEAVFSDDETKKENEVLSNDDIVDHDADDNELVMKAAKDTAIAEYEGANIPRTLIWDY